VNWILLLLVVIIGGIFLWLQSHFRAAKQSLLLMDSPLPGDRIVVFAPHPDDETLGTGGYLQHAVAVGARVRVVLMTNGEYGRTGIDHLPELPAERASGYADFGIIRQQESLMALGLLGVPQSNVTFLCYPNHLLTRMSQPANWLPSHPVFNARLNTRHIPFSNALSPRAPYCGEALLRDVETVLLNEKPTVVITLHPNDIHPDHWATSAITQYALNELAAEGKSFARTCRVYAYLIHRGHWPRPKAYRPRLPLLPPPALAGLSDWRKLPLTRRECQRKSQAIKLFQTQGGGTQPLMRSFTRDNDLFALLPNKVWPAAAIVPPTVVLSDPNADFKQGQRYPAADIQHVSLARKHNELIVSITTYKPATSQTRFFILISAGGANAASRVLTEYQWQHKKAAGTVMARGALSPLPPRSVSGIVDRRAAVLRAAWPLVDNQSSFFMLQAWTVENKHLADVTAVTVFRLENSMSLTHSGTILPAKATIR